MTYPDMNYRLDKNPGRARPFTDEEVRQLWKSLKDIRKQQADAAKKARYQRPAQPQPGANHWSLLLGVKLTASIAEINAAYRLRAKSTHADAGGSDAAMSRLNVARDRALKERKQP